ncbi:hypothetical protein Tco_0133499 [Tanacetum coccineum]
MSRHKSFHHIFILFISFLKVKVILSSNAAAICLIRKLDDECNKMKWRSIVLTASRRTLNEIIDELIGAMMKTRDRTLHIKFLETLPASEKDSEQFVKNSIAGIIASHVMQPRTKKNGKRRSDVDVSLDESDSAPVYLPLQRNDVEISDQPKEQLGVFSAATALVNAARRRQSVENVQTYTRRRREVSIGSGRVSTASRLVSTADISIASELDSIAGVKAKDKGKVIMHESEPPKKIKKRVKVQMSVDEEFAKLEQVVKESSRTAEGRRKKSLARKRAKETLSEESAKKQKLEDDIEKELQVYLNIVPEDESLDVESFATKYPIVDWETQILANDKYYYQIKRADGSDKHYKLFSAMLYDFDRQDVLELYRLVKERFQIASPEGYDLLLWGDLKTMIEPNEEDERWRNQQD